MFETHESGRIDTPSALLSPGEHVWGYVYSRISLHWLHVVAVLGREVDGYGGHRNFYLVQVGDLIALIEDPEWEIIEVSLVSPRHINKTNHWKMDLLDQILVGQEPDLDHIQYGYVFVLKDGNRYVVSLDKSEEILIGLESIYRAIDS